MSVKLVNADKTLMDKLACTDEIDLPQLFQEDKQPLKSPTEKDKRYKERLEAEETYLNVRVTL